MQQVADYSDAHILIIDDEAANLKLLEKVLRSNGYRHIQLLQDPELAIGAYLARQADIILLDLQMPSKDGFTLLEEFHALQDPLLPPIVVLTAYQQREYRLRALQAGARDFLTKPFDHIELLARVRNLIEMQRHLKVTRQQKSLLEQENILAQSLYENLLGNTGRQLGGISCYHRPASLFSGDMLLAGRCPATGACYVMLADAMGHGLAAAISLIPISLIFHTAVKKASSVSEIAAELNAQLNKLLPSDRFVAAIIMRCDCNDRMLSIWNGGMPAAMCISPNTKKIAEFRSENMALGILPPELFQPETKQQTLTQDEKVILYSDGVTEALNADLCSFSQTFKLLRQSLCESEHPMQVIRQALVQHIQETEPADDICLAEIDISALCIDSKGEEIATRVVELD